MSIQFFPQGIPFSSSMAESASVALKVSTGGFPVSASLAEYVTNYIGPIGPVYITVNSSGPI